MRDLAADVAGQVAGALAELTLTPDDYGYAVTFAPFQQAGHNGIAWTILVTVRSPLIGKPPLGVMQVIMGASVPAKPEIRDAMTKALAELEQSSRKILLAGNGHAPTLPGRT